MTPVEQEVAARLLARRKQLAELAQVRQEQRLVDLLRRVEGALAGLEIGDWGTCTVCHEPISVERLEADPLIKVCLECLTVEERHSLERDLEAAARLQRSLLPPPRLAHGGWELAFLWEPRGAVSGDHVDLLRPQRDDEPLHLLLGDVVGKGVAASLLQSHLHALFRALAAPDLPLGELLARVNRIFFEATTGKSYATMVAARLHAGGRVELANAGHPRPLLADARGVRPVEGAGLPLGLFAGGGYESRELSLRGGETLLVYSDGWTEATAADDEEFGIGRAAAALRRAAKLAPAEVVAACRGDMETFLAGRPRTDDLTLLALRRNGGSGRYVSS
ncbi:MAG TPA: SpoIIE family protein phosphatase [Thermoanaerobaculia bacterium]|nr:SpoIIE family protein phosphatase [Thermoanaerobaculia bacterium]